MAVRTSPAFFAIGIIITILLLITLRSSLQSHSFNQPWTSPKGTGYSRGYATDSEIGRAGNATLGFEKVLVIGLHERSDRRDAIVLQSSLTGFDVDWVEGIRGADVPSKALPLGLQRGVIPDPYIGSWRGHMNAVRSIIENKLSTALIMEDDVDWDVRLLSQMQDFAKGVRSLAEIPETTFQHSPYGDDWDLLWVGHCGEVLPKGDDRRYVIKDDETVAPKEHQPWLKALKDYPERTRIIHKAGAPICAFAYAVSARGARKILLALAMDLDMKNANLNLDNALAYLCRDGRFDIKCYSVQPMLFYHHRPAGAFDKDSDLAGGDKSQVREKGFTDNIIWSARLNLENMIMGTTDYVMQW